MGSFGSGITTELYQVKYVTITQPSDGLGQTGSYPDPYFLDHRLTPKSALWSGGGEPYIDYDCPTETLSDPYGIWGFEEPADFYLDGSHLRQIAGFPSFMAGQLFTSNDASSDGHPSVFCGNSKSTNDWMNNPSSAYNSK